LGFGWLLFSRLLLWLLIGLVGWSVTSVVAIVIVVAFLNVIVLLSSVFCPHDVISTILGYLFLPTELLWDAGTRPSSTLL
jgi:hypothetical protein